MSQKSAGADQISLELLDRYLARQGSEEDVADVRAWMAQHSEHMELVEGLEALQVEGSQKGREDQIERALQRVHIESGVGPLGSFPHRYTTVLPEGYRWLSFPFKYAIMGLAIVVAVAAGWMGGVYQIIQRMSTHVSAYATGNGERATITLPDGSQVVLNVASRLDVPASFSAANRTVHLVGEALFTVTHRAGAPFIVKTGATETRVLGTTFVVRRYTTDSSMTVAVQDGKVAVSVVQGEGGGAVAGSTVVSAGQGVSLAQTGAARRYSAQSGQFTFVQGILTLDDMTFRDAIKELNRWYNVDIQLADSKLAARGIGGSFAAGSISDLAALLELTYNVRVERFGRVLTLFAR